MGFLHSLTFSRAVVAVGLTALCNSPLMAQALWQHNGVPICVRPTCSGFAPQATLDQAGGTVLRWQRNPTLSDEQIYAKRLLMDASTPPGWLTQGTLIVGATDNQYGTDIVSDGAGGAYIVWDDRRDVLANGIDVYLQHVLVDGQIAPGWPAEGVPAGVGQHDQDRGHLMPDGEGGVYVLWDLSSASGDDIMIQRFASDGSHPPGWPLGGVALRSLGGTGFAGAGSGGLVPDGTGGCLVLWGDGRSGVGHEIYAQRVTAAGEIASGWPAGGRLVAGVASTNLLRGPFYAMPDGAGGAYFAWGGTSSPKALDDDIYATHILSDGTVAPGWPATGLPVAVQSGWQFLSGAAADGSGGLLLSWQDSRTPPARAYVQRLRPDGTPAPGWPPQGVPVSDLPGYHAVPRLAPDGEGGAFVTFQEAFDGHGFVQRVLGDGSRPAGWPSTGLPLVDPVLPNTRQREMAITADGEGGAVVVWNDTRNGVQNQLYAQRYSGDDITAALTSLVRFEALPDRVTLLWSRGADAPDEVRIERRNAADDWASIGRAVFVGSGRLEYVDATVTAGERYAYRLAWTDALGERYTSETPVLVPLTIALALHGLRPNPSQGDLNVTFSLPRAGSTVIEVLDLGGRVVRRRDASHLGAGNHVIRLTEGEPLHPGVYWVRLSHEGRSLSARGMVLR